ncbi:ABC transporter ATP-binding protein [Gordonia sp. (in: high G+C Gram-positive bacteria)]|uniref:ABC transporter ATP-binding protein n=1 Tax=Gordonia sp. (in: high G+C Gram-positive bacteria) TaxID=84139 RepID=UPI00169A7280|nr:ATP-binding cassette domain-containing protein [Gordonia sp. (in: high G+C Gram-positive bacteria)]NLG48441.1 ABC transporter ATP-binding protein [Gordonia sp. (in: high G+C Gram-positive bacteria)]
MNASEPNGLAVAGLNKRFGDLVALRDVSFAVAAGEIFGFVGSNGAGKSTTMRIILGVLAADSGRVSFGGRDVDADVRRRIGYMPEERGLYPKMKVGEQLIYLARLHGLSSADAAERTAYWTERLGIDSRIGDNVSDLSLGNQQRVQLAAALVFDPDVLVLDEPFSGLDPVAVDVMSDVLTEKAQQGVPVIFSSHQLDLVQRLCDTVGIIAKGEMRALGSVDELRRSGGVHLEVEAPAAASGWADGLPGVTRTEYGTTTILSVDDGYDDQQILQAALATGPVHRFATTTPELTELFREVVTAS